jgi:hypothetical protein
MNRIDAGYTSLNPNLIGDDGLRGYIGTVLGLLPPDTNFGPRLAPTQWASLGPSRNFG